MHGLAVIMSVARLSNIDEMALHFCENCHHFTNFPSIFMWELFIKKKMQSLSTKLMSTFCDSKNNRQCNSQVVKLIMHYILTMPVWRINGNWNALTKFLVVLGVR